VGARLDHEPELLFTLRGVDPAELVEAAVDQSPAVRKSRKGRVLAADELSSIFGVDIDMDEASSDDGSTPARAPKRARRTAQIRKKATSRTTRKKTETKSATKKPAAKKPATKKPAAQKAATRKKASAARVRKTRAKRASR
jgi:uncharacterized Zn finger protein